MHTPRTPRFLRPGRSRRSPRPLRSTSSAVLAGLAAVSLISPAVADAQSSSSSSSSSSSPSDFSSGLFGTPSEKPAAKPGNNPWSRVSEGLDVTMVGDLLGTHQNDIGAGALDLGIMAPLGIGKEFAIVFGDSFTGRGFGQGEWLSPIGAVAEMDGNGRITLKRPLNSGDSVKQLINYRHDNNLTLIPSDVININGVLYMQGMWNAGLGNIVETQIWKSTDNGRTWTSVGTTSPRYMRGLGNMISWEMGPDGYIYVVSSDFRRQDSVYLSRFREQDIGNRESWEIYDPATGTWGSKMGKPMLSKNMKAGEMSLRYIDGHWVLAMFNAHTRSIEVRVSETIARNWDEIAPARPVVAGDGNWRHRQDENNFTQLYGGYIVPGSTLDNMDLVVSQWNTSNNSRYMSTQFNVKGLDKFFGVTPSDAPAEVDRGAVGDQTVLDVNESDITQDALDRLDKEQAMEEATDVTLVPLN
nr:DUF4185 domain-containing protein [Corynebacterium sp. CCUG 65737]